MIPQKLLKESKVSNGMKKYILLSIIVFSALWFFSTATAQAAMPVNPSYVSPGGSGSTCTIGSPCALSYALANVAAGNTVYLRGGDYNTGIIVNGKSGTLSNRITFAAYGAEVPVIKNTTNYIFSGRYHALHLYYSSYIKITGIHFERVTGSYFFLISHASNYNEIENCIFNGTMGGSAEGIWKGNIALPDDSAPTNNWIHGSTFYNIGNPNASCSDNGGLQIGTVGSPYDNASGHQTLENNVFYNGGHHLIETFSKYNVIRNNVFHNAGWYGGGTCTWLPSPRNGLYGNRLLQLYDGSDSGNMYNLVEGNRFGNSAFASDGGMDGNLTITSHGNLIRYNFSFYSETWGMYFKAGANSIGADNRVYNNTLYKNGYDSMAYTWAGLDWRFGIGERCLNNVCTGNVIKNNIIYNSGVGDISDDSSNTYTNNWITTNGNPLFTNPDVTNPMSTTLPNLSLQSSSPAKDGGTYLTTATNSGSGSMSLVVADSLYFQDGTRGSDLARGVTLFPDWIAIGSVNNAVQISSINYSTNTITLVSPVSWSNGAPIWLYKKSDGSIVLSGSAPDYGAYEYLGVSPPTCTYTYSTWGACQSNNTQSRTVISSSPSGCTGTPVLTQSCTYIPPSYFSPEQYVEAELGLLASPMQIGSNSSASGGQYISVPTEYQGSASFTFNIQQAGQYKIEARVLAQDGGSNSFYIGLDGQNPQATRNNYYVYAIPTNPVFTWDNVSLNGNGTIVPDVPEFDPITWDLSAGTHTFTFYGREANTQLDQIILKRVTADTTPPASPTGVRIQ